MNKHEVVRIVEVEMERQIGGNTPLPRDLGQWGDSLIYYAKGVRGLAADGCIDEALHELRNLLAVGLAVACHYGLPERIETEPSP